MKRLVGFCVLSLLLLVASNAAAISDDDIFNQIDNREWVYDTTINGIATSMIMYIGYDKKFSFTFASYSNNGDLVRSISYSGMATVENGVIYLNSSWEGEAREIGQNGANSEVSKVNPANFAYIFISCEGINLRVRDKFDGVEYIFR
ncbi:MAG: hypothetical protein P9X27_05765 [Candidatus Kaelpia aquatica]|nr:hypothetical protein [Candidatus Kaelpia aquatica]